MNIAVFRICSIRYVKSHMGPNVLVCQCD